MAGIQDYLNLIKTAIYGKDVRQAIHDGILQCYLDASGKHYEKLDNDIKVLNNNIEVLSNNTKVLNSKKVNQPLDNHNQPLYGTSGQVLRTKGDGTTEWVNVGLPTDAQTAQAVLDWLDEHPEATTTVQDGSLTEPKFSGALKLKTIKDYVTPEMYGAKGDGVTDDTVAIQQALNNENGYCVYFSNKNYVINESVYLTKNRIINDGIIRYTGTGYALILSPTTSIDGAIYNLGQIIATDGSCLMIDSTNAWLQYLTFDFKRINAGNQKDAITAKVVGNNWINEIRFINGRFGGGLNAIYIDHSGKTSQSYTSHWTFDKVGFEQVTNGVNIPDGVTRTSFINCRAEESLENVVVSRASTFDGNQLITWSGSIANGAYWQNCDDYLVSFLSGYIDYRGTQITVAPITLFNKMLYGLDFTQGAGATVSEYGAYSYDADTTVQEIDFAKVFEFNTAGTALYQRAYVRRFNVDNNVSATKTNIYLDDRMFLTNLYAPSNSYLLQITLSPNVELKIYDKKNGVQVYSKTGESRTTYLNLKITRTKKNLYVEELTLTRKGY